MPQRSVFPGWLRGRALRRRMGLGLALAAGCLACAGTPVPSSWSYRSSGVPVETERAQFHAGRAEVKAAIEQELAARGFTLAPAQAPYDIVSAERTDCGGRGEEKRSFEWDGRCTLFGDGPICRRKGVAVSLEAGPDGTLAKLLVRSVAWKEGDLLSSSVDETFKGCIPKDEGAPARLDALRAGPAEKARSVLEAVREQLEARSREPR